MEAARLCCVQQTVAPRRSAASVRSDAATSDRRGCSPPEEGLLLPSQVQASADADANWRAERARSMERSRERQSSGDDGGEGGVFEALSPYRIHLVECINGLKGLLLFWLNLVVAEWGKGGFCHQLELP